MREGGSYNELKGFRSAHNSLTDEEFEELAGDDTGEPMTRRQLREIAREKRARARDSENEASENQAAEEDGLEGGGSRPGPDVGEEIAAGIGGQVRGIVAQLPGRPDRVRGSSRRTSGALRIGWWGTLEIRLGCRRSSSG